jgi:hypothetical protein
LGIKVVKRVMYLYFVDDTKPSLFAKLCLTNKRQDLPFIDLQTVTAVKEVRTELPGILMDELGTKTGSDGDC